jgi:flavin-dependent dehydrogenase
MYDAIVIGARCAGAATALLLARQGRDVLMVDRAALPSEIPHGHFIHRHGPGRLAAWGLLDAVLATGCPAVTSMTTDFGDYPMTGRDLAVGGVPLGLGPRRARVDAVLAQAAVAAGAELRDRFAFEDVLRDDDGRATGIRGRALPGGAPVTERARLVVGADGRGSPVARQARAAATHDLPTVACWYFTYYSGVPHRGVEMYLKPGQVIFTFPTNDGLQGVFVAWPIAELPRVRAAIEPALEAALEDGAPELAERVRGGEREERLLGATRLPNVMRRAAGPGWALAGDAACHKDPVFALGMCDALRDADRLAGAAGPLLDGDPAALDAALAGYADAHDAATTEDFHFNFGAAHLGPPPPEVLAQRAALRGDQAAINRWYLER